MKHWKIVLPMAAMLLLLIGICLALLPSGQEVQAVPENETSSKYEEVQVSEQETKEPIAEDGLETRLMEFADVIYTYDTRVRKFYEGAEKYMTKAAYQMFVPLPEAEAGGEVEEMAPVAVISTLQDVTCYLRDIDDSQAEVLMESQFSFTQGGNGFVTQYLKLFVAKEDSEWKITKCQVIDTIEQ